jgi:beta-lactamase regulating signal transducer with metallopeptidase domain
MSSTGELTIASLWLTYLIRSSGAYLLLRMLCSFVQNSRLKFRLFGAFLAVMVAAWFGLCLTSFSDASASGGTSSAIVFPAPRSLPLDPAWVTFLAAFLRDVLWIYVPVLAFLLLRFCIRFWQLRVLLRASHPGTEALSFLLELVRHEANAPPCEVRVVAGLRSPAATGWWHPKVLLPSELLSRLDARHLMYVLRHELMHIRRRDYLWDRLATLGCYVVFFNPLVWLTRRHLRWERELTCDEDVVKHSREHRLEYAGCLTTLASFWFLEEKIAGAVDFLSPPTSLLAIRVRALLTLHSATYFRYKRAADALMVTAALSVAVWLVPKIELRLSESALRGDAKIQPPAPSSQTVMRTERKRMSKPRKLVTSAPTEFALDSHPAAPNLQFQTNIPVFSGLLEVQPPTEYGVVYPVPTGSGAKLDSESRSRGSMWNESRPHAIPSRAAKVAGLAERAVRLGIAVAITQIGGHEHEKELRSSGQ